MQKHLVKLLLLILLLFVSIIGCSQETGEGEPTNNKSLDFATLSEGSAWYVYGATMAELLRENIDEVSSVDVLPYSGGIGNVQTISEGEADLGFTFTVTNRWALDGSVAYEQKYDNLRLLAGALDEYYIGIIMSDDFIEQHGITSIADIKEKEIPVDLLTMNVGSQGEFAAKQVFEAYGMSYEDLESYGGSVEHTSFDVVQSSFQDGRGDMFIQVMTEGHPAFTEISIQTPVTFMSVEPEYIEKLGEYGLQSAVFPGGNFEGQDDEVETIGFNTTLVVTEEFPEELAYEITKNIVENKDKLTAGHRGLGAFDPEKGMLPEYNGGLEIHPGALKYYEELGWVQ